MYESIGPHTLDLRREEKMATPRSVKKQATEAAKLQKALNTDPADAVDPIEKPAEELEQSAVKAEIEQPNLDQPVAPVIGEEPKADGTDWEKRFKGLQTRYNREVPELRGQLSTAESETESMKKDLEELRVSIQNVEPQLQASKEINFSDEEIEQYGEGYIGMMKKVAEQSQGEMAKQIVDLQKKLADVTQGVTQVRETVVVNTERDFFSALTRAVKTATGKDWKEINEEDEFHNFLAVEVDYSGVERQEYLAKARKNLDVDSAAKFFIDYAGPSSSKNEPSPSIVPEVPEELVTPETSSGGIPPIAEDKVYTNADVDQFYADKRKGKYKDPVEARKIEQDILAAGREGRIVSRRQPAYA